jgi:hypothetical protein
MTSGQFDATRFAAEVESFVEALSNLTARGEAQWVRQTSDPGYVHCFIASEQVIFEIHCGPDAEIDHPAGASDVAGVGGKYRNTTLLYLPSSRVWGRLLELLLAAPADDEKFRSLRHATLNGLFGDLFRVWKIGRDGGAAL